MSMTRMIEVKYFQARGNMPHIHGVILDVDGTLVDSNDAHARQWVEAMAA